MEQCFARGFIRGAVMLENNCGKFVGIFNSNVCWILYWFDICLGTS